MKILVLGATGFVGSYMMERAIAAGHDVLGTSCNPTIDPSDWTSFQDRVVRCDIRYREQTDQVIAGFRPDVVYLLSAQSYPALSWKVPIETLQTNVVGTANVYESIRAADIDPVVVVACSSAQYGEVQAEAIPVKESHPLRPLHPYGISKVATEMLALQYWTNFRVRSVCARIFNTTGARKSGDVCADLTQRVARIEAGQIAPVLKVGNQDTWRAITDVRDLASALELLAEKGEIGGVYNISGARTYRIGEIVERVVAAASMPISVETDPVLLRPSDEKVIFGDSGKLIAHTGWSQRVDIGQTLQDMLVYWRSMLSRTGVGV
ncbi:MULTISPECIES: GDP-mannose 4,6-dehydratase [Pseudoxanthomonas]|uniref:GDP-4-dehydro-6-deoxy-D-mannose reductase n=1 Tax=Pseudoxanthomonas winnipegensis TaxID=2480810 RepID=A0AAW8GDB1_9GAMM|nr:MULTISPECIES: GDP-mannose 4,6-dehydratase [Pseudoxanthomonas]MDQ1120317.1 GDP-4-dehydro-6-deoxy-D-mannose reductase [Pseudoxanthomonas winnipegensis]MDQ1133532.1 GDP-4-dehydro-6-deoxy-D-mannose reductase [Pseudoxanthomonas winnipegensis]MDR6140225.1 GDP-4-dehydro-6-deoxy-D-mannose reductase [Pseudoxanthomonas sp. SORGH_AS_0997]